MIWDIKSIQEKKEKLLEYSTFQGIIYLSTKGETFFLGTENTFI